jgi:hypothetical protein
MVIAGAHPFERWMDLPFGPRGWLTVLFFILAAFAIPVWVSFHSSVLGDLLAGLTHTRRYLNGATIHLWGCGMLIGVLALALAGGYSALEKIQIVIVVAMLAAVVVTLILFGPDWFDLLLGFVRPQRFAFPEWMLNDPRPAVQKIAERPVWVELSLYVGVIGGAGYDYLAYTSYLRDKRWGNAAQPEADRSSLTDPSYSAPAERLALDDPALRKWIRAPLIDCTLSFLTVLAFTTVFVASGKLVLGPERQIPGDGAFLDHQAQFVTNVHPWLYPLYVVAVFLALGGTLYGTLEIAPTILREALLAVGARRLLRSDPQRMRNMAIIWCGVGALVVLAVSFVYQLRVGKDKPPGLTDILIPVNMFTGVFACGVICLLNPWMDRRLPPEHRMPTVLVALNLIGGVAFILVSLRSYWEYAGWSAIGVLSGTLVLGVVVAWLGNFLLRKGADESLPSDR